MTIEIKQLWDKVDLKYVGFSPDTISIKPVHIANGMFREALNQTSSTRSLNRFAFWQKADGTVPKEHELEKIFEWMTKNNRLESTQISINEIKNLRVLVKKALNADEGVYTEGMDSYSAANEKFLSKDYVGQSGGEFVAIWLRSIQSPLLRSTITALKQTGDIITALCHPLFENNNVAVYNSDFDAQQIKFLNMSLPPVPLELWEGLKDAAETLDKHIQLHPNKLYKLRLMVLFASFVITRHMSCMESYYVPGAENKMTPFLFDFTDGKSESVVRASTMSYTYCCQAISRFYTWAFSNSLKELFTVDELLRESTPIYKNKSPEETEELWTLAIQEARDSEDPYNICAQTIYDILALKAEDPTRYFRALGNRSGLMWPPIHPSKRFKPQQDMLEMLVRASVDPGDVIDLTTLQDRLWSRFGIVIGGRSVDDERLLKAGIYQADSSSLGINRDLFASRLNSLDFAKLLADGVLQIELGVT